MTFDLDPATERARADARAAAATLKAVAGDIDAAGSVPPAARAAARAGLPDAAVPLAWVAAIEEVAAISGSLAVDAALSAADGAAGNRWTGLRGVDLDGARRARSAGQRDLAVAAVLLGLARAALDEAIAALRVARADGAKPEQQHWGIADAATELDAARLLVWRAASGKTASTAVTETAMARLQARGAAEAAVAAARRVLGADAAAAGTPLDRVTRDVATATLVFGGADGEEAAVAAGVLPG